MIEEKCLVTGLLYLQCISPPQTISFENDVPEPIAYFPVLFGQVCGVLLPGPAHIEIHSYFLNVPLTDFAVEI